MSWNIIKVDSYNNVYGRSRNPITMAHHRRKRWRSHAENKNEALCWHLSRRRARNQNRTFRCSKRDVLLFRNRYFQFAKLGMIVHNCYWTSEVEFNVLRGIWWRLIDRKNSRDWNVTECIEKNRILFIVHLAIKVSINYFNLQVKYLTTGKNKLR